MPQAIDHYYRHVSANVGMLDAYSPVSSPCPFIVPTQARDIHTDFIGDLTQSAYQAAQPSCATLADPNMSLSKAPNGHPTRSRHGAENTPTRVGFCA
ncbi:hypothetical protein SNOG_02271 [Parastagonospora nodorum SN15]|uniref:Uncharacterized protein n=1 Tax=Phaeosphaeria nodorum (strain SN15 / ATCC MYA-4574 / FGSC 10173) TaxID=321614 RepID=Q0V143_PHANO|nr:hypothetical protein SNOG_02271 [Parastagonospora nodorum SN15]EAT90483.1 hypothetical protein SNOG_02271 [Parastagonospora nodorum SN15]